jgi:hypothetical protein
MDKHRLQARLLWPKPKPLLPLSLSPLARRQLRLSPALLSPLNLQSKPTLKVKFKVKFKLKPKLKPKLKLKS